MVDFDSIKEAAAKLEQEKSQFTIDDVKELHYALIEARKAALADIEEDIKKAYPGDEEKQKAELAIVETTLKRLERSYRHKAKKDVEDYGKLANRYIEDLEHITGADISQRTIEADLPEDFWKNQIGWYESAVTKETRNLDERDQWHAFEEGVVESMAETWKEEINAFQDENGNIIDREAFQTWLTDNQEELRKIILRPLGSNRYLVDFSNISEEFEKAVKESSKEADFIARNIGLADLLSEKTQAVTVWGKRGTMTGLLNPDFERSNGLKGGYFTSDGEYLTLWHGAVVSLDPEDSEDEKITEDFFPGIDEASEQRDAVDEMTSKSITIVNLKDDGTTLSETRVSYAPVTIPSTLTPDEKKEKIDQIKASVEKRRKEIENPEPGNDLTGEFEYNTTLYTIIPSISNTEPLKRDIKAKFKRTDESEKLTYEDPLEEYEYACEENDYSNISIAVPLNNTESFVLKTKYQKGNGPKTLKIYESKSLAEAKKKMDEDIDDIEKGWVGKAKIQNKDLLVLEFDENCSKETIDRYLRLIHTGQLGKIDRIIVRGKSYATTLQLIATFQPDPTDPSKLTDQFASVTFKESELTDEGLETLKLDKDTISKMTFDSNDRISKDALAKLREETPNLTEISFRWVKHIERGALAEIALFPKLEKLVIDNSAMTASDIEYLGKASKLTHLELLNITSIRDIDVQTMLIDPTTQNTNLTGLKTLKLTGSLITDEALKYISRLENLETLDLSGNSNLTYRGIQNLIGPDALTDPSKRKTNLVELDLSATGIDNAALAYLKIYNLQKIDLSKTHIDGKGVDLLIGVIYPQILKSIDIEGINFSEENFNEFLSALTDKYHEELLSDTSSPINDPTSFGKTAADIQAMSLSEQLIFAHEKGYFAFEKLVAPNGTAYTFETLIDFYLKIQTPEDKAKKEKEKKEKEYQALKTKKLEKLNKLFGDAVNGLSISITAEEKETLKYKANVLYKDTPTGYWLVGYIDVEDFRIVTPENKYLNLATINGDTIEEKLKYFKIFETTPQAEPLSTSQIKSPTQAPTSGPPQTTKTTEFKDKLAPHLPQAYYLDTSKTPAVLTKGGNKAGELSNPEQNKWIISDRFNIPFIELETNDNGEIMNIYQINNSQRREVTLKEFTALVEYLKTHQEEVIRLEEIFTTKPNSGQFQVFRTNLTFESGDSNTPIKAKLNSVTYDGEKISSTIEIGTIEQKQSSSDEFYIMDLNGNLLATCHLKTGYVTVDTGGEYLQEIRLGEVIQILVARLMQK